MFDSLRLVPYVVGPAYTVAAVCAVMWSWTLAQRALLLIAAIVPVTLICGPRVKTLRGAFWTINVFTQWIRPSMFDALDHILKTATKGDAESIVRAFDEFCWQGTLCMNVGDVKGAIADAALVSAFASWKATAAPGSTFVAVELGSHCGYSTIRFARQLSKLCSGTTFKAVLHAVDPDALGHAVSAKLIWFSELGDWINPVFAFSGQHLRELARSGTKINFFFLDHVKELYLSDLQLAVELNLLPIGSVTAADNVLMPGAPDYKQFMVNSGGKALFDTTVHDTFVEYSRRVKDQVLVSIKKK